MKDDQFSLYLAFLKPQSSTDQFSMTLIRGHDAYQAWIKADRIDAGSRADWNDTALDKDATKKDSVSEADFSGIVRRFFESMSGYIDVVRTTMILMPHLEHKILMDSSFDRASKTLKNIFETTDRAVFGVANGDIHLLKKILRSMQDFMTARSVLPSAILLSLVATFDSLIGDMLTSLLMLKPERFFNSSKTLNIADVLRMNSLDDVKSRVIRDEVNSIMRDSHLSQLKQIEGLFNFKFPRDKDIWCAFIEIFERRNLVAHGNITVNDIYIKNCQAEGVIDNLEIGKVLTISPNYLLSSADILTEAGMKIIYLIWEKMFPDEREAAYGSLNEMSYELIRYDRFRIAIKLLEFAIHDRPRISDRLHKMILINLANVYKKSGDRNASLKALGQTDWSASSVDFRLCISSIQDDIPEFISLLKVVSTDVISLASFREWPVFDWVRENENVKSEFMKVFGEEIGGVPIVTGVESFYKNQEPSDL